MSTQSSWTVTSKSGEAGYSELHIRNVTEGHAGYYECVSSDGKGRYVTVSRRAWLTVVSKYIIPIEQLYVMSQGVWLPLILMLQSCKFFKVILEAQVTQICSMDILRLTIDFIKMSKV